MPPKKRKPSDNTGETAKTWLSRLAPVHIPAPVPQWCKCGRPKRPQFDKCYGCFVGNKENVAPSTPAVAPTESAPPPPPKAAPLTQLEKELQRIEHWQGDPAWGPRVNTSFLVRYHRVVDIGAIPADEELLALIHKHQHRYVCDQNGLLRRKVR